MTLLLSRVCPACGSIVDQNDNVCNSCDTQAHQGETCKGGHPLLGGESFCTICGSSAALDVAGDSIESFYTDYPPINNNNDSVSKASNSSHPIRAHNAKSTQFLDRIDWNLGLSRASAILMGQYGQVVLTTIFGVIIWGLLGLALMTERPGLVAVLMFGCLFFGWQRLERFNVIIRFFASYFIGILVTPFALAKITTMRLQRLPKRSERHSQIPRDTSLIHTRDVDITSLSD